MVQSQNEPHVLARFEFILEATPKQEELIWQQKDSWVEEVRWAIKEKVVRPKFGDFIFVRMEGPRRGSLFGAILFVGAAALTTYELLAQYRDFVGSIQLIMEQVSKRKVSGRTSTENINVQITNVYFPEYVISYLREHPESGIERGSSSESPVRQQNIGALGIAIALALAFAIGVGFGGRFELRSVTSKITRVLQPVQNYDFESVPPENFRLLGNPINYFSIDEPGFDSKKSLQLNLFLAPFANGTGHGGFSFEPSAPVQAKAFSAQIFLPEGKETLAEPIYATLVADFVDGRQENSSFTQLKPGHWTPLFWGTPFSSWEKPGITRLQLWIIRLNETYNGPVYVDDLVIYELAPELRVASTPTPAN